MKRTLAFLLACVICLSVLSGCGTGSASSQSGTTAATEEIVRDEVSTYPAADGFSGGDGTEENPYQISSAAELAYLSECCLRSANDSELKYCWYVLTDDIYLNETDNWENWGTDAPEYAWVPIEIFYGSFDGQGHTIYGMYINNASVQADYMDSELASSGTVYYAGLFADASGSSDSNMCIQNLNIAESYVDVTLGAYIGSIAAESSVPILNCSSSAIIAHQEKYATIGGIVGWAFSGSVEDCTFSGQIIAEGESANIGGIAAVSYSSVVNCVNEGTIVTKEGATYAEIGGIVYYAHNAAEAVISGCVNRGELTAYGEDASIGGVINTVAMGQDSELADGEWEYSAGSLTITGCTNEGNILANAESEEPVGGVIAYVYNNNSDVDTLTIENCCNTGSVTGDQKVGGVVGSMDSQYVKVEMQDCENTGEIFGSVYVGGIVSAISSPVGTATVRDCTNTGNVFATESGVGGIVGEADSISLLSGAGTLFIESCTNSGTVSSTEGVSGTAGVLGMVQGVTEELDVHIANCFNDGSVCCETSGRAGGIFGSMTISRLISVEIAECGNSGDIIFGNCTSIYNTGTSSEDYSAEGNAILVEGGSCVGGIAGMMQNFCIEDCVSCGEFYLSSKENGTEVFIGGIIGQYRYLDENDYMEGLGIRDCVYSTASEGLPGYILCFESDESLATISNVQQVSAADALAKLEAMKQTA